MDFDVTPTQRCRASGFDMVSLPDALYVGAGPQMLRFDPKTGEQVSSWSVPLGPKLCWGNLRVVGDLLVATAFEPQDLADAQAGHDGNGGDWAGDRMPMAHLLVLDRRTGELKWSRRAAWGFVNRSGIAAGGGKVFCVDLVTEDVLAKWREVGRKLPDEAPALYALDLETGEVVWRRELALLVRNIVYSEARDMLIVPCRNLKMWKDGQWVRDRQGRKKWGRNVPGRMRALRGRDGEVVWDVDGSPFHHPHIVLGDLIIDRYGVTYDLSTGARHQRTSPITGLPETWSFRKSGCNHLVACDNLVTWRTAFYDLEGGSGVMELHGLDAGCSPTLLPAGGVLNIPNFGTHHKRNRMTAMALVHRPGNELWTKYAERAPDDAAPIRRGGFNFAAPGDRVAGDGTVWLAVTARKRENIKVEGEDLRWPTGHPSVAGSFVGSSSVVGASRIEVPTVYGRNLPRPDGTTRRYRVRLHFADAQAARPGDRVFDVALEGRPVLEGFDIVKAAGGPNRTVVREFAGIEVTDNLDITFDAIRGEPLLSGVELVLEKQ